MFPADFEVLLYDLTSAYFECDPPEAGKRKHGLLAATSGPIACQW
jgi:hypothetical protein